MRIPWVAAVVDSSEERPQSPLTAAAVVAGIGFAGASAAITYGSTASAAAAIGRALMVAAPIRVGVYAWHHRPAERFGQLLTLAGFGWFVANFSESDDEVLDRREISNPVDVRLWGPDGEALTTKSDTPEDPGPFCFPPIAAAITAGARLKLALLERLVRDADGNYAFCDTDSLGIVASELGGAIPCQTAEGDQIEALPWSTVRAILERFNELNPYDRRLVPSVWKPELKQPRAPTLVLCHQR